MKQVAKLVIMDNNDKYLLMYRSSHPTFGDDPDLPGGTLENEERPIETMIREVYEEAGIKIIESEVQEIYHGDDYSDHRTHYWLFKVKLGNQPAVNMSWEHSSYEWLERSDFLQKVKNANDTYMQMVYDRLK